jgi:hypothetical protein
MRYPVHIHTKAATDSMEKWTWPDKTAHIEIDSIKAIGDKITVIIGKIEIDANLTFTLFRNNFMILDPPYPTSYIRQLK